MFQNITNGIGNGEVLNQEKQDEIALRTPKTHKSN